MVTGGVVDFDPASNCYSLPAEHAAFLTRAAAADNMAVFGQYIAVMGGVEDDIVDCFRKGGGVPYEKFPRFHEVMAEDSGQSVLSSLESHILPLAPGLTERLAKGIRVLDAGCGRGRILARLAELYTRSRFVGMDLSREATGYARDEAAKAGLKNVEFVVVDLSTFDTTAEPEAFDFQASTISTCARTVALSSTSMLESLRTTAKTAPSSLTECASPREHNRLAAPRERVFHHRIPDLCMAQHVTGLGSGHGRSRKGGGRGQSICRLTRASRIPLPGATRARQPPPTSEGSPAPDGSQTPIDPLQIVHRPRARRASAAARSTPAVVSIRTTLASPTGGS
jgi:hypothetical protein